MYTLYHYHLLSITHTKLFPFLFQSESSAPAAAAALPASSNPAGPAGVAPPPFNPAGSAAVAPPTANPAGPAAGAPPTGMPVMFDPSQFSQNQVPTAPTSTGRGPKYGQRRAYPK